MRIKKTFVITMLMLGMLMIGAACAADNDTAVSSDDTDAVLAQEDAETLESNDGDVLKDDYSETSFKALNRTIHEATGLEIELDNNYTYDGSSDSEFRNGIILNKSITINGNGKTISGSGQARIFNITSGAVVTIKNLNLINANAENGGAIYVDHAKLTITDSSLTHNKATRGAAIYNDEGTVIIDNVIFTNNYVEKYAGAIYNEGRLTVINALFENNTAVEYAGGAIRNYEQLTVIKSTFKGNRADTQGAAISNYFGHTEITECVFENNEVNGRGGAVYSVVNADSMSEADKWLHISYSNFTNNTAKLKYGSDDGGAIYSTGYLNATGNIFANNHAKGKDTISLLGYTNGIFVNNTYVSTDIDITGLTLSIKDGRTSFNATEDIILSYDVALKHPNYYKDIKTGLRGITLCIDGENRTTLYEDITLSGLKPGPHTAYFTLFDKVSNVITFYVYGESQISTPEASYDYAEGTNIKIPLAIVDRSELHGTLNVTVKDADSYRLLSVFYNVANGYKMSTSALAEALENMYGTLGSSYVINLTYSSEYGYPSSTEFTLNINDEKSTRIIYDVINSTEGNLQINITVVEAVTGALIPGAAIQITGDIIKNTISGIITDDTLTAGDHTITVTFPETGNYNASQATINFNVEMDKDKIIENLTAQIRDLENNLEGNLTALQDAQRQIEALQSDLLSNQTALQDAQRQIEALKNDLLNNQTALQQALDLIETIKEGIADNNAALKQALDLIGELQKGLADNQTALKDALSIIQILKNNLESNQTALKEAQKQISALNDEIAKLKAQQNPASPKATKITAAKKTFKKSKKVKKYTITLKSGSKAVAKVKVYLKIKGKTYKATTNAKGKAIFKIKKLTKKGKYSAKITFKGNKNYKASKKTVKIIIK